MIERSKCIRKRINVQTKNVNAGTNLVNVFMLSVINALLINNL
jgi:hypothetical protein